MIRYLFIGSVEYSAYCLRALIAMAVNIVGVMCPYREVAALNSDYLDLGEVVAGSKLDVHYFKRIADEEEYIRGMKPDIILVLGLSQVIPKSILEIPSIGCIGSHPALLPENRGRHPIIWAIANGLRESGISLFWINGGMDTGDIWAQKRFNIDISDDAASIYKKVKELSVEMLKENLPDLEKGIIKRVKQDHTRANFWRRRTERDGEIDWRMSSRRIYDLVRALTRPYVGAHCVYKGKEVKIWKVELLDGSDKNVNLEPGKIISTDNSVIEVKTGDGVITILEHSFDPLPLKGEYL